MGDELCGLGGELHTHGLSIMRSLCRYIVHNKIYVKFLSLIFFKIVAQFTFLWYFMYYHSLPCETVHYVCCFGFRYYMGLSCAML